LKPVSIDILSSELVDAWNIVFKSEDPTLKLVGEAAVPAVPRSWKNPLKSYDCPLAEIYTRNFVSMGMSFYFIF
jgi:hypothetical protein